MKMICKATCQYKGVTRTGAILDIPEADLELDIVKYNFEKTDLQAPKPLTLGNKPNFQTSEQQSTAIGDEKKNPNPDNGDPVGLTNGSPLPPTIIPPKDETPETAQNPDKNNPPPVEPVFAEMTVVEIRAWLDVNGAIYPDKANKSELVASAKAAYEALNKGE